MLLFFLFTTFVHKLIIYRKTSVINNKWTELLEVQCELQCERC